MKKVDSVRKIKLPIASKTRSFKAMTDKIHKKENKMINPKSIIGKTGGTSFENYNLDLMKLR